MFTASRNFQRHSQSLKIISSLLNQNPNPSNYNLSLLRKIPIPPSNVEIQPTTSNVERPSSSSSSSSSSWDLRLLGYGGRRWMSTSKRPNMRSRVERRMQRESGKTLRQIRTAKKLKLKLMTEEERLLHNLRRAKKKVALLLQKLKKYELPELPSSRHDPELLTPEQFQAYKKIGFRNKNYAPIGVRGVFGGVVQNMHLHWKFHETVQVCCDNFPKEKIKEMATMLARLSGGIVINIHNVKTIIMFRGRNYRQPKNLIPLNTLTKRKALFKARFEQALESQKLNIKKIEQQLRRMGINPDDPVAMASLHKVASTFFNAVDKKEGSPYVFWGDDESPKEPQKKIFELPGSAEDSDQEELDKFIAEIEDAVDKEWEEEEIAEKEELIRIRYWNKEDSGGRFKPERYRGSDSDDGIGGRPRGGNDIHHRARITDSETEDGFSEDEESDENDEHPPSRVQKWNPEKTHGSYENRGFKNTRSRFKGKGGEEESESENTLSDLDNIMGQSDSEEEHMPRGPRPLRTDKFVRNDINRLDDDDYSEIDCDDDDDDQLSALRSADDDYSGTGRGPYYHTKEEDNQVFGEERVVKKPEDENWDSN